jgi:hypothetical protein
MRGVVAGRNELINALIDRAMRELRENVSAGRQVNRHALTTYFEAAMLAGRDVELAELTTIADGLPPYDPLAGAIHNFEPGTARRSVRYRPPSRAAIDANHPPYDHAALLLDAQREEAESVQLTLAGRPDEALASARDEYELELAISTRALMRDFDGAEACLERLPPGRMFAPHLALLTEAFHATDEPVLRRAVSDLAERFGSYGCLVAIIALANRLPWLGYPFSDS